MFVFACLLPSCVAVRGQGGTARQVQARTPRGAWMCVCIMIGKGGRSGENCQVCGFHTKLGYFLDFVGGRKLVAAGRWGFWAVI